MITLMAFMICIMITLVMLIIIIISQVLGHTSCVKYAQKINHMDMLSMNKVTIKSFIVISPKQNHILMCNYQTFMCDLPITGVYFVTI